jgi:hypothetical protein
MGWKQPAHPRNNSKSILQNMKKFLSSIFTILMAGVALAQTGPGQYRVDTIQDLREITLYGTRLNAWVGGGAVKDDGLGGVFFYDSASTAGTNVHAVYEPLYSSGRWFKLPTSVAWNYSAATKADDTTYGWRFLRGAGQTNVFSIGADNNNVYMQTWSSKPLYINSSLGANNVILNATGGNVGIGTNSPGDALHVVTATDTYGATFKNSTGRASVNIFSAAAGNSAYLNLGYGAGLATEAFLDANFTARSLRIGCNQAGSYITLESGNQAEAIRILSSGNVGIGTTAPLSLLSVNGEAGLKSAVITNSVAVGGGTAITAIYSAAAELDFPSIASQSSANLTITVTGAGTNSVVAVSKADGALTGHIVLEAWVSSADTVTVRALNATAGAIDPATGSYRVTVFQY